MGQSNNALRDRMLRDAIANVLRGITDPAHRGNGVSLVDAGRVGHVAVEGDRVVVELVGTRDQRRAAQITAEVRQRLAGLPELARADVAVLWSEPQPKERRSADVGEIQ
jgi:metal-sulfur cluster biosynthetic enzyme